MPQSDPSPAVPPRELLWPQGRPSLAVFSRTIAALPLGGFLPELGPVRRLPKPLLFLPVRTGAARRARIDAVAGWGVGRTHAERVRAFARREGSAYVALEDGFLRSVDPGPAETPASLVADPVGVYYDATRPSLLERLLEDGGWESPELMARARLGIALLKRLRLSKYNPPVAPRPLPPLFDRPYTLVLDQRRGDMSVRLGGSEDAFPAMLAAAQAEHPDAVPVVKLHPDELGGRHAGHLRAEAERRRAVLFAEAADPWALLAGATTVYTVSSLLGFEALLAGRPTRCFGMPFYAGWGVTGDERACARRTRRRSVEEIFAAAYLLYARYVDVDTGAPAAFEAAAEALARRRDARVAGAPASGPPRPAAREPAAP
jgi:capsular polysaccharide export protein